MSDRANWAALVPFTGIQNFPASLARLIAKVPAGTVEVPLAKLTPGGTDGVMVFINGLFDASLYVAPT